MNLTDFKKISANIWEIPKDYRADMLVPARIYANQNMLAAVLKEKATEQLVNLTTLPGIVKYGLAMPDIHQGYGFPIGGVAAFDTKDGIISPGGVGYDINCGVRLLTSSQSRNDLRPHIEKLANQIYNTVPSGMGSSGKIVLTKNELNEVLNSGINWAIKNGFASNEDAIHIEEQGCFKAAQEKYVSVKAKQRGIDQLGTLGSGNHFLEIQEVVEIYDQATAEVFGLSTNQITVMIHTGSRGLGHQVCTDYVKLFNENISKFDIKLIDRELACAPFNSSLGQEYFHAMAAAANFAWTNRQIITDTVRNVWTQLFGGNKEQLKLIYDIAHNIAKLENYSGKELIVHRKGATRAFGPKHQELPAKYQITGQPVLIPGSMGTCSYVLAGTNKAMQDTFGSACHGAGRRMSRIKSKKNVKLNKLMADLKYHGITTRSDSMNGLLEEAPEAYKDVNEVVDVIAAENICKKVAKLRPIIVIKG